MNKISFKSSHSWKRQGLPVDFVPQLKVLKMRWVRESLEGNEESRTNSGKISTMADFAFICMHRNDFIFPHPVGFYRPIRNHASFREAISFFVVENFHWKRQ